MALRRVVLISATASALVAPTARRPLQTVAQRSRSIVGAGPLEPIGEFLEQQAAPPSDAELPKGSFGAVVTGGAAGVGFAYADEFLRRGHRVVICDIKDPADAVASLKAKYGADAQIFGEVCDVSDTASVRQLAKNAKAQLKSVDYWINNAALNGGRKPFIDVSDEAIEAVVKVNMFGVLICTKVAMELMLNQVGKTGHVFNTVGSGVRGGGTPGYVTYGAAKRGLPQMTDSLVAELEGKTQGYAWPTDQPYPGKVKVHTLSRRPRRTVSTIIGPPTRVLSTTQVAGHGLHGLALTGLDARAPEVSVRRAGRDARGGRAGPRAEDPRDGGVGHVRRVPDAAPDAPQVL